MFVQKKKKDLEKCNGELALFGRGKLVRELGN